MTDGLQIKEGAAGYIAAFDLSDFNISIITEVQAQKATGEWSEVETTEEDFSVLSGYLDDTACPDLAFSWIRNSLMVFVKSTYEYLDMTNVTFCFYRNAPNSAAAEDKVDIPGELELFGAAAILKKVYQFKGLRVPFGIDNTYRQQKTALGF